MIGDVRWKEIEQMAGDSIKKVSLSSSKESEA